MNDFMFGKTTIDLTGDKKRSSATEKVCSGLQTERINSLRTVRKGAKAFSFFVLFGCAKLQQ